MSKEQQSPDFAIGIPIERTISSSGKEGVILQVMGTSKEALEGLKRSLKEHGEVSEVNHVGKGRVFGVTNWNNCDWNPEGPEKKPWMNPENPSRN